MDYRRYHYSRSRDSDRILSMEPCATYANHTPSIQHQRRTTKQREKNEEREKEKGKENIETKQSQKRNLYPLEKHYANQYLAIGFLEI